MYKCPQCKKKTLQRSSKSQVKLVQNYYSFHREETTVDNAFCRACGFSLIEDLVMVDFEVKTHEVVLK